MKIEDFIEINPSVNLNKGEEYPFVAIEDIFPFKRYVETNNFKVYKGNGSKFLTNDILFARITPCLENGKIAQYVSEKTQKGFGSTELFVFRAKEGVSIPAFVYYIAVSDIIRGPAIKSMFGTSGRQRADLTCIKNIEIHNYTLSTQRKIASILSAYDDLIENNLKRIKILEEMAQMIYREWFVKFRFPGHEKVKMVNSELGMIPEGWEVKAVESTFEIVGGGTPSKEVPEYWEDGTINWYSPTDLTASKTMFMERSGNQITKLGLKKSSARLFPSFSVMMTSRATLGVLSINTTEACTNQGFITCIPNEDFPLYMLFHWLKENVEFFISLGTGATFKEITKGVFKTIKIVVPAHGVTFQFEETIQPLTQEILNLTRKNTILRKTRDLLLPKLISGEIDVEDLDIAID